MHLLTRCIFCIARAVATRESGNTTVEFLLLVTLLALGSIAGAQSLALSLNNAYEQVATNFSEAMATHTSSAGSGSGASGGGNGAPSGGRNGGAGSGPGGRGNQGSGSRGGGPGGHR